MRSVVAALVGIFRRLADGHCAVRCRVRAAVGMQPHEDLPTDLAGILCPLGVADGGLIIPPGQVDGVAPLQQDLFQLQGDVQSQLVFCKAREAALSPGGDLGFHLAGAGADRLLPSVALECLRLLLNQNL